MKRFDLVIPAYNEEKNLEPLISQTLAAAKEFGHTPDTFRLFLVNNGSSDGTAQALNRIAQNEMQKNWFQICTIEKNQGYGHGISQGLKQTQGDWVGWTHADLQCDPRNAFIAFEKLRSSESNGFAKSLIKGRRQGRAAQERLVSFVFALLSRLILGFSLSEINAQPKVFHRELLAHLKNPPTTFAFDLYALYQAQKLNYQILEIPVHFPPRQHGVSHWAAHFSSRYKTIWGIVIYMATLARREGRL